MLRSTDLNILFDSFFQDPFLIPDFFRDVSLKRTWLPSFPPSAIKIDKKTKTLTYELAVAGYPKENINIDFDGDYLVLELDKVEETENPECECLCCSVTKGKHTAKYFVPSSKYDQAKAQANLKDGMLKVSIPTKEQRDVIKIPIQTS